MGIIKFFVLLGFLALHSCAGSVKISGKGCQTFKAQFVNINEGFNPNKSWEQKVWTYSGSKESPVIFSLKELLAYKEIECKDVKSIRYKIGQSLWDQIFSMPPFIQRMTLTVEVETKS